MVVCKSYVKNVISKKPTKKTNYEKLLGLGIRTHSIEICKGYKCCFHNPSNHKMVNWNMLIRFDRDCLVERLCPKHNVGHPDPDSLVYLKRNGVNDDGIHGCCGCC